MRGKLWRENRYYRHGQCTYKGNTEEHSRNHCCSDKAINIKYSEFILITSLMHWLLFIHKILFFSTCFEHQVLIFRRIQLYTCSIWYCHSLWEFVVACRYAARVRTDCRGKVVGRASVLLVPTGHHELSWKVTVPYAACIQLYPPEDEHLRLETCRGKIVFYE